MSAGGCVGICSGRNGGRMKKRIKISIGIFLSVLLLLIISIYAIPKLRITLFVNMYHELIEENLKANNGVPADDAVFLGYKSVNSWDGAYPMTEFVIMTYGNTYYGCYYSPDDVPLAFQNTNVILNPKGTNTWYWDSEGDNHGSTSKLMDCWYFFKASF